MSREDYAAVMAFLLELRDIYTSSVKTETDKAEARRSARTLKEISHFIQYAEEQFISGEDSRAMGDKR